MKRVIVYGHSDDCIEVEGDIREEYYAKGDENFLCFSDGTVLKITYDGCWNISLDTQGKAEYTHQPHDNEVTTYSDRVTLVGDINWCAIT